MDTLSHALISTAIAGLSGHYPAINDPIYIAVFWGAQAPDFDIIAQLSSKAAYLKQHRSFSHSLPGAIILSAVIGCIMSIFFPNMLIKLLLWSFIGSLSHIFFDYLNTHGAAVFWPLKPERKSFCLINVFDPFIAAVSIAGNFLPLKVQEQAIIILLIILNYIILRIFLKCQACKFLKLRYTQAENIVLMPSLHRFLYWDFVIQNSNSYCLGHINLFFSKFETTVNLPKQANSKLMCEAQKTPLGKFFSHFTPYDYFSEQIDSEQTKINIYDLRYFTKQDFLHSATIIFGSNQVPCDAYIKSYREIIKVPC